NIPKSLPQSFEEASEQKYQGGHFWTPITPIQGSILHAGSHLCLTSGADQQLCIGAISKKKTL
ncbi:hypothetical protein, partial [Maritimibacter dapengensis]